MAKVKISVMLLISYMISSTFLKAKKHARTFKTRGTSGSVELQNILYRVEREQASV